MSKPNKRPRLDKSSVGGPVKFSIPFTEPGHGTIHGSQVHYMKAGTYVGLGLRAHVNVGSSLHHWRAALSWAPRDNTDYGLDDDNDGEWVDELVEGDVDMEQVEIEVPPRRVKKKTPRSMISRRPNVFWKDKFRSAYLDELLRWEGRGDFRKAESCPECVARGRETTGKPEFRCDSGCLHPELVCQDCCVRRHRRLPLHRIKKWADDTFVSVNLKSLGLRIQLNHTGSCRSPVPCHQSLLVLHTNGFHEVAFDYCGCSKQQPQHIQLIRRQFYPSSQIVIKTCATFELLDHLHNISLTTKGSLYDLYRALEKQTDGSGLTKHKSKRRALMRILIQWRHLHMLKRAGRGHDPGGVEETKPGQVTVPCPSCPHPGINLPDHWKETDSSLAYLYRAYTCMDANFRLKNQLISSYSQDPGLGTGWSYMIHPKKYEQYARTLASDADISTCVGFQAIAQSNTRFTKGLRYTGVGGLFCGRSEMVLPSGVGNLIKGERYANMDYIFVSGIRQFLTTGLSNIMISYDIACQWFTNLSRRLSADEWPTHLDTPDPSVTKLTPAIPKLHEPMHEATNHQQYSLNHLVGVGLSDFETPERFWAGHNLLGLSTKSHGPGSRHDILDDNFNFWNWMKYITLGSTYARRYRAALAHRNVQVAAHKSLTEALDSKLVEKWDSVCVAWERDVSHPKTAKNPFEYQGVEISEVEARRDLLKEEARRLAEGGAALHETSPISFIIMGLDLEETQRRVRRTAKSTPSNAVARQEGGLTEQRNQLQTRIRGWELLLPIYMPGLSTYQAKHGHSELAEHPEDHLLWLPSKIPSAHRLQVCHSTIPAIEEGLRTRQCYDSLDNLRHSLTIKSRLIAFKNQNIRGQKDGTRSRAIIDRIHDKARAAAVKYREARVAKVMLSGGGAWEQILRVLGDEDIRTFHDAKEKSSSGRPGTVEDGVVVNEDKGGAMEIDDLSLTPEERSRRDGTGETRRTLSWIWLAPRQRQSNQHDDEVLMVEWAKSRSRANRGTEEVLLLKEEMRRTLEFLQWKGDWWKQEMHRRRVEDVSLAEGIASYALRQAHIQLGLMAEFKFEWDAVLDEEVSGKKGKAKGGAGVSKTTFTKGVSPAQDKVTVTPASAEVVAGPTPATNTSLNPVVSLSGDIDADQDLDDDDDDGSDDDGDEDNIHDVDFLPDAM